MALQVTQTRSAIGTKPKQRGTLARARPGPHRLQQHPAGSSRDPRHDQQGPPSRSSGKRFRTSP